MICCDDPYLSVTCCLKVDGLKSIDNYHVIVKSFFEFCKEDVSLRNVLF